MKIEHAALWVRDLETMRTFYSRYFEGQSNGKYLNTRTGFASYFLTFDSGSRLELMQSPLVHEDHPNTAERQTLGFIHLAFSVGSRERVDALTKRLRTDGYTIIGEPRVTGDGYYESVVLDPENNRLEITV